jgi:hypothetical protein
MWIAPDRKRLQPWLIPGFAVAVGVAIAITLAMRDALGTGLAALAVLSGYALQLALRRREALFGAHDSLRTGHRSRTHLRAAAMTGDVLIAVLVGLVIVQSLRGAEIAPLVWLLGVGGGTYLLSLLFFDNSD